LIETHKLKSDHEHEQAREATGQSDSEPNSRSHERESRGRITPDNRSGHYSSFAWSNRRPIKFAVHVAAPVSRSRIASGPLTTAALALVSERAAERINVDPVTYSRV
jgi:hypothetical protein